VVAASHGYVGGYPTGINFNRDSTNISIPPGGTLDMWVELDFIGCGTGTAEHYIAMFDGCLKYFYVTCLECDEELPP
jgi:hypothetical protein